MVNIGTTSIVVQQTLHGYNDGHHLLAASCQLPIKTRREMGFLSDLSGPTSAPKFETYLTCYPLLEINAYAIARTWLAPEMKRPGCVWTHTLIVDEADLVIFEVLPQLRALFHLFKRPAKDTKIGDMEKQYGRPVNCLLPPRSRSAELDTSSHKTITSFPRSTRRALVERVYGTAEPVIFFWNQGAEVEDLALSLWLGQWPRLRRQFSFCTGVTATRVKNGIPFDLQFASPSTATSLKRETPNASFIGSNSLIGQNQIPSDFVEVSTADDLEDISQTRTSWVDFALEDLTKPNFPLRQFFRFYAADVTAGRQQYRVLAQLFGWVEAINRSVEIASTATGSTSAIASQLALYIGVCSDLFPESQRGIILQKANL